MKTCIRCKRMLPPTYFTKDDFQPGGRNRQCKECQKRYRMCQDQTAEEAAKVFLEIDNTFG